MKVNYDKVSEIYDNRYKESKLLGVEKTLTEIINTNNVKSILEVGCGTGYWLKKFTGLDFLAGVDFSRGMLKREKKDPKINYICADANNLPLLKEKFDLIYCINAIHHFNKPLQFINETYHLLKKGGRLCIFGANPSESANEWYIFDYFRGTFENDKKRFPETNKLKSKILESGFSNLEYKIVDIVDRCKTNYQIFDDLFLVKDATSELYLISQNEYDEGIKRMKAQIEDNKNFGKDTKFRTLLHFYLICGVK
ncbi:MAG: methyltransferase domain-containing protein [bacterium]